ncbi:protease inhibitor [Apiospora marii]|uniref:protease inhibitor n=1 Tax=Apiospora marii TaxID=335849 RepID=UPI00312F7D33
MESCGYSRTGPSRALRATYVPEPDDPDPIETCHWADFDALGLVQFQVNEHRAAAGLRAIDETTYRYIRRYVGYREEQRAYERMLADGTLPDPCCMG